MQFGAGKPPVGIVYDTEFGAHECDALALALLYALDGKSECRVSAVTVSRPTLHSAAAAEVIGRFFAGAVSANFGAVGRTLPIGLAEGKPEPDTPLIKGILDGKKFEHGIRSVNDTAEPHAVIRNALTAQHDQNAIVICTGRLTNLKLTLELPGAKAWIERKSRYLVLGATERDLAADPEAAKKVLAEWPVEIFHAGGDLGDKLPFPLESLDKDFAWAAEAKRAHPVVDATRAAGGVPNTTAMAAILQAIRPAEKYFAVSGSKPKMLALDPSRKEKVLEAYTTLASAKPVVRGPRRPPA